MSPSDDGGGDGDKRKATKKTKWYNIKKNNETKDLLIDCPAVRGRAGGMGAELRRVGRHDNDEAITIGNEIPAGDDFWAR